MLKPGESLSISIGSWNTSLAEMGTNGTNVAKVKILFRSVNRTGDTEYSIENETSFILEQIGIESVKLSEHAVKLGENVTASISITNLGAAQNANLTLYAFNGTWHRIYSSQTTIGGFSKKNVEVEFNTSELGAGVYAILANLSYASENASRFSDRNLTVANLVLELYVSNSLPFLSDNITLTAHVEYGNGTNASGFNVTFDTGVETLYATTDASGNASVVVALDNEYSVGSLTIKAYTSRGVFFGSDEININVRSPIELLISTNCTSCYPGDDVATIINVTNVANFDLHIVGYGRSGIFWRGYEQVNSSYSITVDEFLQINKSVLKEISPWNAENARYGTYGINTIVAYVIFERDGINYTIENTTTFTLEKAGIIGIEIPEGVEEGSNATIKVLVKNIGERMNATLTLYVNSSSHGERNVILPAFSVTEHEFSLALASGTYSIAANLSYDGRASYRFGGTLTVVKGLKTTAEIVERMFSCLSYYIPGEKVTYTYFRNVSDPKDYKVTFKVIKNNIIYYEVDAVYKDGLWYKTDIIPNIPYYVEGNFSLYAYVYYKNSLIGISYPKEITILHPVELLSFSMEKKFVNYGDKNSFSLEVKNRVETSNVTCLAYFLGLNASIIYQVVDRSGRTLEFSTDEKLIKPNTTEFFTFVWDTANSIIDQNHSVFIRIKYRNPYFEIENSRGATVDHILPEFMKMFYVNPITVDLLVTKDNLAVKEVSNESGNVTIVPYVINLGYFNITVNISVEVFKNGVENVKNISWSEISLRRYGKPTTTIFSGENLTIDPDAKNYTFVVNVSYINPDNLKFVTFTFEKVLKVYPEIKLAGFDIYVNGVKVFKEDLYNSVIEQKNRFRINYTAVNMQDIDITGEIKAELYKVRRVLDKNRGVFVFIEEGLLAENSENITVYNKSYRNGFIDIIKDITNPKWSDLYSSDGVRVKVYFNDAVYFDDILVSPAFIEFKEPESEDILRNGMLIAVYLRNMTTNNLLSGKSVSYKIWDGKGRIIAEGTLSENNYLSGLYEGYVELKSVAIEEGDVILEVSASIDGKDVWKYAKLRFEHLIDVEVNTKGVAYPGESIYINFSISANSTVKLKELAYRVKFFTDIQPGSEGTVILNRYLHEDEVYNISKLWKLESLINGSHGANVIEYELKYADANESYTTVLEGGKNIILERAGILSIDMPEKTFVNMSTEVNVTLINIAPELDANLSLYVCNITCTNVETKAVKMPSYSTKREGFLITFDSPGVYRIKVELKYGISSAEKEMFINVSEKPIGISSMRTSLSELAYGVAMKIYINMFSETEKNVKLVLEILNSTNSTIGIIAEENFNILGSVYKEYSWDGRIAGYYLPTGAYTLRAKLVEGNNVVDYITKGIEIVNLSIVDIIINQSLINGEAADIKVKLKNEGYTTINYGNITISITRGGTLYKIFNPEENPNLRFENTPLNGEMDYEVTWIVGDHNQNPIPLGNYTVVAKVSYGGISKEFSKTIEIVPGVVKGTIAVEPSVVYPFVNFTVKVNITNKENRNVSIMNVTLIPPKDKFVYIYDQVKFTTPKILSPNETITVNWTAFTNETGVISGFNVRLLYNNITIDPSGGNVVVVPNVNLSIEAPEKYPVNADFRLKAYINVSNIGIKNATIEIILPSNISGENTSKSLGELSIGSYVEEFTLKANWTGNYTINATLSYLIERAIGGEIIRGSYTVHASTNITIVYSNEPWLIIYVDAPKYWVVNKSLNMGIIVKNGGNSSAKNLTLSLVSGVKNESRHLDKLDYLESWNETFSLIFASRGNYTLLFKVNASNANETNESVGLHVLNHTKINITKIDVYGKLEVGESVVVSVNVENIESEIAKECYIKLINFGAQSTDIQPKTTKTINFTVNLPNENSVTFTAEASCINAEKVSKSITVAISGYQPAVGGGGGGGAAPAPRKIEEFTVESGINTVNAKFMKLFIKEYKLEDKTFYKAPISVYPILALMDKPVFAEGIEAKDIIEIDGDVYEVANKMILEKFRYSGTVVLARGDIPADAVAAIAFAKISRYPIILTKPDELVSSALLAIDEISPMKVIIVGGEKAISKEVENYLRERYEVERIWGETRYETAVELAKAYKKKKLDLKVIVVTDGRNISTRAVLISEYMNAPIIYVKDSVPKSVLGFLKDNRVDKSRKPIKIIAVDISDTAKRQISEIFADILPTEVEVIVENLDDDDLYVDVFVNKYSKTMLVKSKGTKNYGVFKIRDKEITVKARWLDPDLFEEKLLEKTVTIKAEPGKRKVVWIRINRN